MSDEQHRPFRNASSNERILAVALVLVGVIMAIQAIRGDSISPELVAIVSAIVTYHLTKKADPAYPQDDGLDKQGELGSGTSDPSDGDEAEEREGDGPSPHSDAPDSGHEAERESDPATPHGSEESEGPELD